VKVKQFAFGALGAAVVAAGLSFGSATPAEAACLSARVSGNEATGRIKLLVERRARLNWSGAVRDLEGGRRFSNWNFAKDRSMNCRRERPSDPWECRARGRPCDRPS
jgi:hypothetical protein